MDNRQYREAMELFDGYIYEKEVPELETYPMFHNIYQYLMLPSKDNLCFSSAFIVILAQLSRPLNFFKFYIDLYQESNQPKVPMNIYGINILKSGGGKGLTNNIVKNLINLDYFKRRYVTDVCRNLSYNLEENEKKDFEKNVNKILTIVEAEEQASASTAGMRLVENELKSLFYSIGLEESKWVGSAFYNLQELADSLENASNYDKDFFSTLKEMYDLGEFSAKALKTGIMGSIRNFYISFLGATTDKTLQSNPRTARLLNNFFISGHARRSLISMPSAREMSIVEGKKKSTDGLSLRELINAKKYVETPDVVTVKRRINEIIDKITYNASRGNVAIRLTDEGYFYYSAYKLLCAERAKNINSNILELETENRFWKALKISGILACYAGSTEINEKHFCEAVKIVEYYAHHFKRCLNNRVTDVNDKIIELLMDKQNFGITHEELRTNSEVLSYREQKISAGDFVKKAMKEVDEILDITGYKLVTEKTGFNNKTTVYAAVPNTWINPCIEPKEPYRVFDNVPKSYKKDI